MKWLRRPTKRTLLKAALFILAGAIINVAVAWGLAVSSQYLGSFRHLERRSLPREVGQTSIYMTRGEMRIVQANGWQHSGWLRNAGPEYIDRASFQSLLPSWSSFRQADPAIDIELSAGLAALVTYEECSLGWPMFALSYTAATTEHFLQQKFVKTTTSVKLPRAMVQWLEAHNGRTDIPWQPLWPGFAINTIFYAGILWLLFTAPGFVRRRIRVLRHHCTACAYPIGTNPRCTECGCSVLQSNKATG